MFNGSRNQARLAAERAAALAKAQNEAKKAPKVPKRVVETRLPTHAHATPADTSSNSGSNANTKDPEVVPEARQWKNLVPALSPAILQGVAALGFAGMTPVQAAAIPAFMSNQDVCVQAVTGSGKTLAFVIPTLEIMLRKIDHFGKHDVGIVVISPTRELAQQTAAIYSHFVNFLETKLHVALCVGGTKGAAGPEELSHSGTNILVGTPGRLLEVLSYTFINRRTLEVLVLDEADRLLDSGFTIQMSQILDALPKQRRTGLFSATLTEEVEELSRAGLRNPVRITVRVQYKAKTSEAANSADDENKSSASGLILGHQATPSSLANSYTFVPAKERLFRLVEYLLNHKNEKIIVFFLTCATVEYVHHCLAKFKPIAEHFVEGQEWSKLRSTNRSDRRGIIAALTGQMPQSKRSAVYKNFREARSGVLLCTDVAARGVDIQDLTCVLQFEAPQNPDYFVHRVGRTARAGRAGAATLFLLPEEEDFIDYLRARNVPMVKQTVPELDPALLAEIELPVREDVTEKPRTENDEGRHDEDDEMEDEDEDNELSEHESENENESGDEEEEQDATLLGQKRSRSDDSQADNDTPESKSASEADKKSAEAARLMAQRNLIVNVHGSDTNVVNHFRAMAAHDRHVFNLASNAFVTSVRAYQEHLLRFIFVTDKFPFRDAALGMGLLYMPRLPDLKRYHIKYPVLTQLHPSNIPYLDPVREAGRAEEEAEKRRRNHKKKMERIQRELERKKLREFLLENRKKKNKTKAKKTFQEIAREWSELKEESRQLRAEGSRAVVLKRLKKNPQP